MVSLLFCCLLCAGCRDSTRHKARSSLQRSINGCVGRRCYHPWWCDFLICRIFGGIYLHCRKREPTLHLQELRTLRAVRNDLLSEGKPLTDVHTAPSSGKSIISLHDEPSPGKPPSKFSTVVRAETTKPTMEEWMNKRLSVEWAEKNVDHQKLRCKVAEEPPSLSDFIKHFHSKRQIKHLLSQESALFETHLAEDVPTFPPNWTTSEEQHVALGGEGRGVDIPAPFSPSALQSGESSPRKRVKRIGSPHASMEFASDEEDHVQSDMSIAESTSAAVDAKDLRAIQRLLQRDKTRKDTRRLESAWVKLISWGSHDKDAKDVSLIKSGVLKEALRKRLLLELQRQQAAAVLIQRSFSAVLERKRQQQQQQQQAAAESLLNPTIVGRPQTVTSLDNIAGQPQDTSADGTATDTEITSPISLGRDEKVNVIGSFFDSSPVSRSSQPGEISADAAGAEAPLPATVAPGWSEGVDAVEQGDTESSRPELRRESTKSVMIAISSSPDDRPQLKRGSTQLADRRKSVTELWIDVNAEVELMVTRTLRRVEYVEWGAPKMFREVCRRDHPLLKLFILNPTFTAVQRTLFFGSISLGILTMCAVFFDQGRYSRRQDDSTVLMAWQSGGIGWLLTLRQIAVLLWSILLSKPIPLTLLFLFRKAVPHIMPSATRQEIQYGATPRNLRAQRKMTAQKLSSIHTRRLTVMTPRRIADLTGRHSGHFSLDRKIAVLSRWRLKERIGITIGLLYWFACCSFLLLFAFSSQLAESGLEGQPTYVIYQDFVMVCSVEFLNSFILQPIIFFCLLSFLLMAVLRVGSFDWVVWMMPHWFDFTFSGAQSLHELTVQLHAISDTHELTRGLVGFAGLNIDSVGMVQDVFSF
ncbi:unnamed protein product [Vitrella brassicaformis CCMP3155]|uniref:Uncharacterized protein n=2 Tax=Vitrella brassicaformis TaxID=1169539 RepID=A0A0G4GN23_VITBC|nr:unnamed protein product [Vitrella brassicaformis CCMP3155]|eukprot:CEM31598.1 unnamed protein product [Vitrella brassicaformis CCMP3155]